MRHIILVLITLFSFQSLALEWCDVKDLKSGAVLYTYEGACDQRKFGGPWGDKALTEHVVNTTKQKQIDDAIAAEQTRENRMKTRIERIRTSCANASGLVKELCDHIIDKER